MIDLGVNIDHVATLREARRGRVPDVVAAAKVVEIAGAHQITVHLRQDRRHIQDQDVYDLRQVLQVRMNLEMGASDAIIAIAHEVQPYIVCLVPENREEVTTEGGLDVAAQQARLTEVVAGMHARGILVSMFIDPESDQVEASAATGADAVELHTGAYANAEGTAQRDELIRLSDAADIVRQHKLALNAGHGLTRHNLLPVAQIPGMAEVNIGHDLIARSVFIGLDAAVKELLAILASVS